jgi:small subunit ribosomal protein S20
LISQDFQDMANTKQAAKRAKQSIKRRGANVSYRSALRTAIKKVKTAIGAGDAAAAQSAMSEEVANIDRIARKGIIHRNKAARHKSRLAAQVKALAGRT